MEGGGIDGGGREAGAAVVVPVVVVVVVVVEFERSWIWNWRRYSGGSSMLISGTCPVCMMTLGAGALVTHSTKYGIRIQMTARVFHRRDF